MALAVSVRELSMLTKIQLLRDRWNSARTIETGQTVISALEKCLPYSGQGGVIDCLALQPVGWYNTIFVYDLTDWTQILHWACKMDMYIVIFIVLKLKNSVMMKSIKITERISSIWVYSAVLNSAFSLDPLMSFTISIRGSSVCFSLGQWSITAIFSFVRY